MNDPLFSLPFSPNRFFWRLGIFAFLLFAIVSCRHSPASRGPARGLHSDDLDALGLAAEYDAQSVPRDYPGMDLFSVDGEAVNTSRYAGKIVLYDFFTTYTPQSPAMMPKLDTLYRRYHEEGLVVIGVSMDMQGDVLIPPFLETLDISYPVFLASKKVRDGETPFGYVKEIPVTILVDRKGRQVMGWLGAVKQSEIESAIRKAL